MDISFVFSNDVKYRIARHAAFWGVMFIYQWLVDFVVPSVFEGASLHIAYQSLSLPIVYLPGQLLLVYGLLYGIIPQYFLKAHYVQGVLLLVALCVLAGLANGISYRLFAENSWFSLSVSDKHSLGMHRSLGVAGFAACIKFMKYWYEKKYLNSVLEGEKLRAELLSLRAQLHPHFLFNTINNIYSVTENTSPVASEMLLRLSSLLRYILYECNKPEILLSQEFKMLRDYVALENIRYKKNLDVQIDLPQDTGNYLIAPLLLLPLVENCFKHGISKMIDQSWINIQVDLQGDVLQIKIMNGQPDNTAKSKEQEGIGLHNVKKRLALLYAGKHELKVMSEPDVFVVALKLELNRMSSPKAYEIAH
ncbi:MAG TPA: histidine kinase [Chryseolinea sp.]